MATQQKKYTVIKFAGSLALLLTVLGLLAAVFGQLGYGGGQSDTPLDSSITHSQPVTASTADKPKYSFYEQLKKRERQQRLDEAGVDTATTTVNNTDYSTVSAAQDVRRYVVQVGAYARENDANKIKTKLESLGYPARIELSSNKRYLVQAGPFQGKDKSLAIEKRLRQQKMDTLLKLVKD